MITLMGSNSMLTPYVTGLVFANCMTAVSLAAVVGALRIISNEKFSGETLTHDQPTPTRLPVGPGELADLLTLPT